MSNFFDSEIIQEELKEINKLQEDIYGSVLTFGIMDRETKLLEKQRVMYTRLSLSDDPQAVEMKENLRKSIQMMGFSPDTDVNVLFDSMMKTIEALKQNIDA